MNHANTIRTCLPPVAQVSKPALLRRITRTTFVVIIVLFGAHHPRSYAADFTNSLGMTFARIPAGTFMMGRPSHRQYNIDYQYNFNQDHPRYIATDEQPAHRVAITRPFLLGQHEVTVAQFRTFVRAIGYRTTAESSGQGIVGWNLSADRNSNNIVRPMRQLPKFTWRNPGFQQSDRHPVVGVSWEDAQAFCQWLSRKESATYRLPTEAEWEYASQAGKELIFSWGNNHRNQIYRHANVADSTYDEKHPGRGFAQWYVSGPGDGAAHTAPVGSYTANRWDLHDLHGNVWEWCEDLYHDSIYQRAKQKRNVTNPLNDAQHWNRQAGFEWRVIRGGAWNVAPIFCRSDVRGYFDRKDAACYLGFRVAREIATQARQKK